MLKRLLPTSFFLLIVLLLLSSCSSKSFHSASSGAYTILDSTLISNDSNLDQLILPYEQGLSSQMTRVINTSETAMTKARPEGLLSNFVADLILEEVNELEGISADFCLLNHGGLRASLPQGVIRVEHIYELMPFDNEAVVLSVSGEKVLEIANYLIDKGGEPVSGLTIRLSDPASIRINQKEVDPAAVYKIVTSDYLANGGDRMEFFSDPLQRISTSFKIRDLIIEHIEEQNAQGITLNSKLDGRISE